MSAEIDPRSMDKSNYFEWKEGNTPKVNFGKTEDWQSTISAMFSSVGLEKVLPGLDFCFTDAKVEKPEEIANAAKDVAVDPRKVLTDALKTHRVIGFGDVHTDPNPQALFLAENLKTLKDEGLTHLVLELDYHFQPYIDEFIKTGKWDPEVEEAIRKSSKTPDAMLTLIAEARKAGIKVAAVDDWGLERAHGQLPPDRDVIMANGMKKILEADKDSKVVFFGGNQHVSKWKGGKNAADLVEESGAKVLRIHNMPVARQSDVIESLSGSIKQPIAVPQDKYPLFKKDTAPGGNLDKNNPKAYDHAFVYPSSAGYEPLLGELKDKGKPAIDVLTDLVKENSVIELFMYHKFEHYDPQRKKFHDELRESSSKDYGRWSNFKDGKTPDFEFIKSKLDDLKKAGVTVLGLAMAVDHDAIEKFNKTGKLELSAAELEQIGPHTIEMMHAAQKAGIRVKSLGVDGAHGVKALLRENPKEKILVLSPDDPEGTKTSVSGKLKEEGVAAVSCGTISEDYGSEGFRYPGVSIVPKLLDKPVGIAIKDAPKLKQMKLYHAATIGAYDHVLFLPRK